MKDLFSAFQQDVFRPIVTLLIPGGLMGSSWFVAILWKFPDLRNLISRNQTESALIITLIMIALGLVCEDLGARIETGLDNRAIKKTNGRFRDIWNSYLRTAFVADPVGRRYLRTLVLRLKFELGCFVGTFSAAIGLIWLRRLGITSHTYWILLALSAIACLFFIFEAFTTHDLLARTREQVTQTIQIVE